MNSRIFACLIAMFCWLACSDDSNKKQAAKPPVGDFFSVDGFVQSQIQQVQSQPFFIYKKYGSNLADSTVSNLQEFEQYAKEFSFPELQNSKKYWYTEANYGDKQNEEYTLNYTSTNDTASIKYADIVFDDEYNKVKRVYLQKLWQNADTSFEQKLYWRANKYLLLIKVIKPQHEPAKAEQIKIVWNE